MVHFKSKWGGLVVGSATADIKNFLAKEQQWRHTSTDVKTRQKTHGLRRDGFDSRPRGKKPPKNCI